MAEAQEVLTLATERKRRKVSIDGKAYEMLDQAEMPFAAAVRLRLVLACIKRAHEASEDEAESMSASMRRTLRDVIPGMPADVQAKLSDDNLLDIIVAFFKATGPLDPRTAEKTHQTSAT